MKLKYAVVGTGGIGGYYGARLAQAGSEVHFLFRSDYEVARTSGLRIDSVKGDFCLPTINAYNSTQDMPVADVVLVCTKTTSNALLPQLLSPIVGSQTVVLLIQNGLNMERELHEAMPEARIAGAIAFICTSKVGPAHIHHAEFGELTMAPYCGECSDVLRQVCADFEQAQVPALYADDLNLIRWRKLVWNIPYNGLSVAMHAQTDELTMTPASRQLLIDLMTEVVRGGQACGAPIKDSYIGKMISFTEGMTPYLPSMRLDYDARRPMEIRSMYEQPIAEARRAGYEMRKTEMLMQQLQYIEQIRDKE